MELLKASHLTKHFKGKKEVIKAVDDVSFTVQKGEFIAITGESGSGKTTLLHMLAGLENPSDGHILMDNTDLYTLSEDQLTIFRRRQIGMVYQFYNLIPTLNVKENILLPILLDNKEIETSYLNQIISTLHIEKELNYYPSQLSGGQQQRVAIARALINHPSVVLADEPTGNLDTMNSHEIIDLLKLAITRHNTTVIMITHDMEIAMQADRIYRMDHGHLSEFEEQS